MCGRFLTRTSATIVLAFAGALAMATLATAAGPPVNRDVTVMSGNEAENAIAVNPANPSNVVAMSTLPDVVAGLAVGVSFDGGQTWTRRVTGTAGDPLGEICCDQQLAWDRFGNLWMTYLVNTNGHVLVALSTDGGISFTKVADVVTNGDQPSIAAGQNSVWISYTASPGKQVQAFGAPVFGLGRFGSFTAPENVPSPHSNGDYGDTAVGPAGQVMVTYQTALNGQGGTNIYTALDPDGLGPAGFHQASLAANSRIGHSHVGGFDFIPAQPHRSIDAEANLAWDRSGGAHNGRVYLIWTQETPNESDNTNIMLQRSDDDGATWSAAVKLNDDNTPNSQYNPAIALDQSSGDVAVSWYDTRNDLGSGGSGDTDGIPNDDFQIWATDSTNGGASWASNFRVSQGTSNATDANTFFDVGDYTHAAFVGGSFWPAWSDNSNSTGNNPDGTLHQFDLYTARIPIP
ncbi:MAG TPA: sialidase family protein [Gaiellaceae bacterium]|nr:sialidase family protein [Gaiellaceae bacterium]